MHGSGFETTAVRSWQVAELLLSAADSLASRFGSVSVEGELCGYRRAASGHCYFSLKDRRGAPALLRCAMFRRAALLAGFEPNDGDSVELRGRLTVYESRGELQLVVESLRRLGEGAAYEDFLRLKAKLAADGLFDAVRKRPLPRHPSAIGIVTSPAAAALHDVLVSLRRRAPHVAVVVYPCAVQGASAASSIVEALAAANRRAEVETLLLCRGGGSLQDLAAFNDERVVRAVAASVMPVVSGIGHETDVTLCEFAADLRAATPTAAAEMAALPTALLVEALRAVADAMRRRMRQRLDARQQSLDGLSLRWSRPLQRLSDAERRVALLRTRLGAAALATLRRRQASWRESALRWEALLPPLLAARRAALDRLATRLDAADPRRLLSRGYALIEEAEDPAGGPLTQAASTWPGMAIRATWSDGSAEAIVTRVVLRDTGA